MSIHRGQNRVRWSTPPKEGIELEQDVSPLQPGVCSRLSELHVDILSAAEVVKQVQRDAAALKQENEILRKELLVVAGAGGEKRELPLRPDSRGSSRGKIVNGHSETAPHLATAERPNSPKELNEERPTTPQEPDSVLPFSTAEDEGKGDGSDVELVSNTNGEGKPRVTEVTEISHSDMKERVSELLEGDVFRAKFKAHASTRTMKTGSQIGWVDDEDQDDFLDPALKTLQRKGMVYGEDVKARSMLLDFDSHSVKEKMKKTVMRPDLSISRFYHTRGYAQQLARSGRFETLTMIVILLNTIWIAIDTEMNEADVLIDADPLFQVVEHCFCCYFTFEIIVRFFAFKKKGNCLRSYWFIFDSCLVAIMVFEDWVMSIILLADRASRGGGQANVGLFKNGAMLRIMRVLRLARLGRAARLMRQSPEVMIMVKALAAATRCVVWTCILLLALMFFFGVCFTQMCKDTELEAKYFPSLTTSLHTLMIAGMFPDLEVISNDINEAHFVFWLIFVLYLLMTTITILNLLIGVLVEVVKASASVERDAMDVSYVKEVFVSALKLQDLEDFGAIFVSKDQFAELLQLPSVLRAMVKVGIDIFGLIDLIDYMFITGALPFVDLLQTVLSLRSSADVTVRDIVELRKFLTYEIAAEIGRIQDVINQVNSENDVSQRSSASPLRASADGVLRGKGDVGSAPRSFRKRLSSDLKLADA